MSNIIKEISESMIARYSKRYDDFGYNVKTLGWGSEEQQKYRFVQALTGANLNSDQTILDIGCGFGDLLTTINEIGIYPQKYTGWDINSDLIQEAKKKWAQSDTKTEFKVVNLATDIVKPEIAEVGFMLGVLNLNFKDKYDNYSYSKELITKAFRCVNSLLIVDFLSTNIVDNYPKEDFIFYHDPLKILEFAFTLTPNVVIKHNYLPIPQKEFTLYLYK